MSRGSVFHALGTLALVLAGSPALGGMHVYGDSLHPAWQDTSWGRVQRDLEAPSPVRQGTRALGVTYTGGWSALELNARRPVSTSSLSALRFSIHGGNKGGQRIEVRVGARNGAHISRVLSPVAGEWTEVVLPLDSLAASHVDYLLWFSRAAKPQERFFVDDVALLSRDSGDGAGGTYVLSVDASADLGTISGGIYGMSFADENLANELRVPLRRWGGNMTTRYNWTKDTSNRGSDWYFENVPFEGANPNQLPYGSTTDRFVEQDRRTGAATLLTVPMIGWTPKSRTPQCSFGIGRYGRQAQVDPWRTMCGNGISEASLRLIRNDPNDSSEPSDPSFIQDWIRHLVARFGSAAQGGVRLYGLDNEPMLWSKTHRDVHPEPTTYEELRDRTIAYATAIKAVDPSALTIGPSPWGWNEYFWSAKDWASGPHWRQYPEDRLAHGNVPLIEWYLRELHAHELRHGARLLDYLDVHYYPEATGVARGPAGSTTTRALRLRSTRALWDPSYIDESWIGEPVRLIPRMREWVRENYPGTKLSISEYNFGGLEDINGALAQADALGIFGREGVDIATLWNPPKADAPGAFAFRMYRNYDGDGGQFGELRRRAATSDPDVISLYAARRGSDGALTILVVNKREIPARANIALRGFPAAHAAEVYRYSDRDLGRIVRDTDAHVSGSALATTLPASSINLFVLYPSQGERFADAATAPPSTHLR